MMSRVLDPLKPERIDHLAIAIGRAVREAQRRHEDPVAAILATEPSKLLYRGKVIDVARRTTDGYLRGVVRFEGLDNFKAKFLPERWEPVYAIVNEPRFSPGALYAIGAAFSDRSPLSTISRALCGPNPSQCCRRTSSVSQAGSGESLKGSP